MMQNRHIHTLKFDCFHPRIILFMAALLPLQPHIREVEFNSMSREIPDDLVALFRILAPQVTHIGFPLWYLTTIIPDLGLSQFASLRSVHIIGRIHPNEIALTNIWRCLLSIVGQMPPTVLTFRLSIFLNHGGETFDLMGKVMDLEWAEFQDKLLGMHNLATFTIGIRETSIRQDLKTRRRKIKSFLDQKLSRFAAQRRLVLESPS
ncbi:hypothetical protein ABKN59_001596 [Abortiporus biennis]